MSTSLTKLRPQFSHLERDDDLTTLMIHSKSYITSAAHPLYSPSPPLQAQQ
jgi:hypothetical protein